MARYPRSAGGGANRVGARASRPGDGRIRHGPHRARACAPGQVRRRARACAEASDTPHARAAARRDDACLRSGRRMVLAARYARRRNGAPRLRHRIARLYRLRHAARTGVSVHCEERILGCRGLCRGSRVTGRGRRGRIAQRGARARTSFCRSRACAGRSGAGALHRFRPYADLSLACAAADRAVGSRGGTSAAAGMGAIAGSRDTRGPATRLSPLCGCAGGVAQLPAIIRSL